MPARLTPRQEECLRLTRLLTDREIAARLGISEPTVKKHVLEACQRLGVNRRKAALAILEAGDVGPVAESASWIDGRLEVQSVGAEAVPGAGRLGYRPPPRDPLVRAAMIVGATVVCAVLVGALTDMVASQHRQVRSIEMAIGTVAPTPPVTGTSS